MRMNHLILHRLWYFYLNIPVTLGLIPVDFQSQLVSSGTSRRSLLHKFEFGVMWTDTVYVRLSLGYRANS